MRINISEDTMSVFQVIKTMNFSYSSIHGYKYICHIFLYKTKCKKTRNNEHQMGRTTHTHIHSVFASLCYYDSLCGVTYTSVSHTILNYHSVEEAINF